MATAALTTIPAAEFRPYIDRGLTAGFDCWSWLPVTDRASDAVGAFIAAREAKAAEMVGYTFEERGTNDRGFRFLEAMATLPTVHEALNERFGNPLALFGSVPGWQGDAVRATAIWAAMCADTDAPLPTASESTAPMVAA